MQKEKIRELEEWVKEKAIKPIDGKYNVLDMLSVPFSDTYKNILRRWHTEEAIELLEETVRQHHGK